jgi:hypothetical protein
MPIALSTAVQQDNPGISSQRPKPYMHSNSGSRWRQVSHIESAIAEARPPSWRSPCLRELLLQCCQALKHAQVAAGVTDEASSLQQVSQGIHTPGAAAMPAAAATAREAAAAGTEVLHNMNTRVLHNEPCIIRLHS